MSFQIDASDLWALSADLTGVEGRIGPAVRRVVGKTALDVERDAKAFAPVDTGNLKSTIGHSDLRMAAEGMIEAEVGPTAEYGWWVEHGTTKMAPHAYLGPALDRHGAPFEQALGLIAEGVVFG